MLAASDYSKETFKRAYEATAKHRGSYEKITDFAGIVNNIRNDSVMNQRWAGYQKQMPYAIGISFDDVLDVVTGLMR